MPQPITCLAILYRILKPAGQPEWRSPPVQVEVGQPSVSAAVIGYNKYDKPVPVSGVILWSSSDPNVASVVANADGTATITPKAAGKITVSVSVGSITASASLEVTPGVPIRLEIVFRTGTE
jgi:hypothetical protein